MNTQETADFQNLADGVYTSSSALNQELQNEGQQPSFSQKVITVLSNILDSTSKTGSGVGLFLLGQLTEFLGEAAATVQTDINDVSAAGAALLAGAEAEQKVDLEIGQADIEAGQTLAQVISDIKPAVLNDIVTLLQVQGAPEEQLAEDQAAGAQALASIISAAGSSLSSAAYDLYAQAAVTADAISTKLQNAYNYLSSQTKSVLDTFINNVLTTPADGAELNLTPISGGVTATVSGGASADFLLSGGVTYTDSGTRPVFDVVGGNTISAGAGATVVVLGNGAADGTSSGSDMLNVSNATVYVGEAADGTIDGSSNVVDAGKGASLTIDGSGNSATLTADGTVADNGSGNTVNVDSITFGNLDAGTAISLAQQAATFINPLTGTTFTLTPASGQSNLDNLTSSTGFGALIDPNDVSQVLLADESAISITTTAGDVISANNQTGAISLQFGSTTETVAAGSKIQVGDDVVQVGSPGAIGTDYIVNAAGALIGIAIGFLGFSPSDSFAQTETDAGDVEESADSKVGLDTPTGPVNNTVLSSINVVDLGSVPVDQLPFTADPTSVVADGLVISTPDSQVIDPNINNPGVFNNSAGGVISGYYMPGAQTLSLPDDTLDDTTDDEDAIDFTDDTPDYGAYVSDLTSDSPSYTDIDPLVIGLNGNGIDLSNWINNDVYFDTNVVPSSSNPNLVVADGELHHTSWVNADDGILVFEPGSTFTPITSITQTLSEFFLGQTFANGFAALASLANPGATVFSATTAKIDPNTGESYFNEVMVWQDTNQDGVSQPSELHSLTSLGITSISLVGSANTGQSLDGSEVTSTATYTTTTGGGVIDSVDLQTDITGDITTTATGGVIINSYSEGSPTPTTTFVAENSSAHVYTVSNGTVTDQTLGQVVATGANAILSSSQGDTIKVSATDPNSYWLGGGVGADTLIGGAGNTVFLINTNTTVEGGTGFNIAKIIGTQGMTVDLAKDNLQEVIGGTGDDVLNASGTTWNVFIQGGSGNNIIIGGAAHDALSGGTGNDLIEAGPGGSVIHAGSGNDLIYGGSGLTTMAQPSYVNAGGTSNAAYVVRLYNGLLGTDPDLSDFTTYVTALTNGTMSETQVATAVLNSAAGQALYGSETNTQFVDAIFQGLLGRQPSTTELQSYLTDLATQTRGTAIQIVAASTPSQEYWAGQHPGASDVIYGGPGNDAVVVGTNNTIVHDGSGPMTVIGNANGFSVVAFHGSYADYTLTKNSDGTVTVTNINDEDGDGTVTMNNVTALDFSNISQVRLGVGTLPVNDELDIANPSQVTTNAGQYVVQASTLLANDLDFAGTTLSITDLLSSSGTVIARGSSGAVNGGTAALSADGSTITFKPQAGFTGVMSFQYNLTNGITVAQEGTNNSAPISATVYLNTPSDPTSPVFDTQWYLEAANVLPVWQEGITGAGVSVGVFDPSGNVDFNNPALSANEGVEVQSDGAPGITQLGNHATLVAGIIAAANNGEGAVGVAYGATLSSEALTPTTSDILTPPVTFADFENYDVVNDSFKFSPPFIDNFDALNASGQSPYEQDYVNAVTQGRNGLGTVIVVAGGNDRTNGGNTNYLNETNNPYVITVGGIDAQTDIGALQVAGAPFSNPGATILVSAPASNISSTAVSLSNAFGQTFGADEETAAGTSFAAPIVSGVAALMLQANPNLTYTDVQQILAYTADLVPTTTTTSTDPFNPNLPNFTYNGADNWNGGGLHSSENYGFGEVDAQAAVALAETWTPTTASSFTVPFQSNSEEIPADSNKTYSFSFQGINIAAGDTLQHIGIQLGIDIGDAADLTVTLISPTGVASNLIHQPSQTASGDSFDNELFTFGTDRDWGESLSSDISGTWQLQVSNTGSGTGTFAIGQMSFSYADTGQVYVYTNEFASSVLTGTTGNAARGTLSNSNGAVVLNAAAITSFNIIDLDPGSSSSTLAGRSLTIAAGTEVTTAYGGSGGNIMIANDFGDTLVGGAGDDVLASNAGNDTLMGEGGNNTLMGGTGVTVAEYGDDIEGPATSAVIVNLANGTAQNAYGGTDTLTSIRVVELASTDGGGNTLIGGSTVDTLETYGSSDTLVGGNGVNTLEANGSSDTLIGGGGTTTLIGNFDGNVLVASSNGGTTVASYSSNDAVINLATGTATVSGQPGDTLINITTTTVSGSHDTVTAGSGEDILVSAGSFNTLIGGAGADTLSTGGQSNTLYAGAGNDTLSSSGSLNTLIGDTLTGGTGVDTLSSTGSSDTLIGGIAADRLSSSGTQDVLSAGSGANVLSSSGSFNTLTGSTGADTLSSSGTHDKLVAGMGANTLSTSGTFDTLNAATSAGVEVLSSTSSGSFNVLIGGSGAATLSSAGTHDTLFAGSGANSLSSSGSSDTLTGAIGPDTLSASGSHDILNAGSGPNTLSSSGSFNTLTGSIGPDSLSSSGTHDTLVAGAGANVLSTSGSFNTLTAVTSVGTEVLSSSGFLNTLFGGGGTDTLTSTGTNDRLTAGGGTTTLISNGDGGNVLTGGSGANTMIADDSGNTLIAGSGASKLSAGGFFNTLIASSGSTVDTLISSGSSNTLVAGGGADVLTSTGTGDTLEGNGGGSTLTGGTGTVALYATNNTVINLTTGQVTVSGSSMSDMLSGISTLDLTGANDTLIGSSAGITVIATGAGDTLEGGVLATTASHAVWNLNAGTLQIAGSSVTQQLVGVSNAEVLGTADILIGGSGNGELLETFATFTQSGDPVGGYNNTIEAGTGTDTLASSGGTGNTLIGNTGTGFTGTDTLMACLGGDNTLLGGYGVETLMTSDAGDTLIAGSGSDALSASGTANMLIGGSGSDALSSNGTNNTLVAGTGDDALSSMGIDDTLEGNGGGSTLTGVASTVAWYAANNIVANLMNGQAYVQGSSTDDSLVGITTLAAAGGGDTLTGGSGNTTLISNGKGNTLESGTGTTTVVTTGSGVAINLSRGTLKVTGLQTTDSLIGITQAEAFGSGDTLIADNGNDVLTAGNATSNANGFGYLNTLIAGGGNDTLSSDGYFDTLTATLQASNATDTLSANGGADNVLIAGPGTDTLSTSESGDTLTAGSGTDVLSSSGSFNTLIAGSGTDTLIDTGSSDTFNYTSGNATIVNGTAASGGPSNQLNFGSGLSDENLWFLQSGNNLQIDVMGTQNQITIDNWFSSANNQLAEITAGGLKIDSEVSQLVQAMATYSTNNSSFNPTSSSNIQAPNNSALQSSIAADWHH